MKDRNFGQVVPFTLSAARLRRGASVYRKRGQHVEALELTRRAAREEDTPSGWLALAQQLRAQGCWEQAASVLTMLLARDEVLPETWLELGRCARAVGWTELAADCLYHYLEEDPWSAGADEARMMLSEQETPFTVQMPDRLPLLVRRGLRAWQEGRRELALRRLRRALRMEEQTERLHITLAYLYLSEDDASSALKEIFRAIHAAPDSPQAWLALCGILAQQGKRRAALGVLRRASRLCRDVTTEELYVSAAWAAEAYREAEDYLLERLRHWPNRIALLLPLADVFWVMNRRERAVQVWRHIQRIDPDDRRAGAMLAWAESDPDDSLPALGALPMEAMRSHLMALSKAVIANLPEEELLRPGSETRAMLDGCFDIAEETQQSAALSLLSESGHPSVIRYLRQLLLHPGVLPQTRRQVLVRLAELGQTGPMYMLMGNRVTTVQCQPVEQRRMSLWRMFLPELLRETRRWRQSAEIAAFAADLWPMMSPDQRRAAAGREQVCYAKAIELLYLRMTGQEEAAQAAVAWMPVSIRRVGRVLRRLARMIDDTPEADRE
ncbi:MAG: hypothetical protein J1E43_06875 [Christensenellaceae bacterium]|nr:hypothetical protein [Christensenellaceae bacterium]